MSRRTIAPSLLIAGAVALAPGLIAGASAQDEGKPAAKAAQPPGPGGRGRPGGPGGPGGPPGGFGPGNFLTPQILRGADADEDGRLSPEEAREAAERLVREADEGKKGSIGVAELGEAINRRVAPPEGFGGPGGPGGFGALAPR